MSFNPNAPELGIVDIVIDGVSCGGTTEDTVLILGQETTIVQLAGFSTTPCRGYIVGRDVRVEFTMGEITDANWARALLSSAQSGSTGTYIDIPTPVGNEITKKEVILKKHVNGTVSADPQDWVTIYQCLEEGDVNMPFGPTSQMALKMNLIGTPDASKGNRIGHIGDNTP